MAFKDFEAMPTGGDPKSLSRTIEIVEQVLAASERFDELGVSTQGSEEVSRVLRTYCWSGSNSPGCQVRSNQGSSGP